jgi:hypothetical protein
VDETSIEIRTMSGKLQRKEIVDEHVSRITHTQALQHIRLQLFNKPIQKISNDYVRNKFSKAVKKIII